MCWGKREMGTASSWSDFGLFERTFRLSSVKSNSTKLFTGGSSAPSNFIHSHGLVVHIVLYKVTHRTGYVSANTRPHQLCWDKREMGTASSWSKFGCSFRLSSVKSNSTKLFIRGSSSNFIHCQVTVWSCGYGR